MGNTSYIQRDILRYESENPVSMSSQSEERSETNGHTEPVNGGTATEELSNPLHSDNSKRAAAQQRWLRAQSLMLSPQTFKKATNKSIRQDSYREESFRNSIPATAEESGIAEPSFSRNSAGAPPPAPPLPQSSEASPSPPPP